MIAWGVCYNSHSNSGALERSPRFCNSNQFPEDLNATNTGTIFSETKVSLAPKSLISVSQCHIVVKSMN